MKTVWLLTAACAAALIPSPARACQCGTTSDVLRAFASTPLVLEVRVHSQWAALYRDTRFGFLGLARTFDASVNRVLKGPHLENVTIADADGNCSFSFVTGRTYLVFARYNRNFVGYLESTRCDPTDEVSQSGNHYRLLGLRRPALTRASCELPPRAAARQVATSFLAGLLFAGAFSEELATEYPVQLVWIRFMLAVVAPVAGLGVWRLRRRLRAALVVVAVFVAAVAVGLTATGYVAIYTNPATSQWFG